MRRFSCRRRVERDRVADAASAAELQRYILWGENSDIEEPIAVGQIAARELVVRGRKGDRAKRGAVVINAALASTPEAKRQGIGKWKEVFDRQWDRVRRFLKTASRKGRFNPEIMAEVLDAKAAERRVSKASIIERTR